MDISRIAIAGYLIIIFKQETSGGWMRLFRMNPNVAVYRNLIKDSEFRKFLPLVRKIKRLEARKEHATYRGYIADVRGLSEKLGPLTSERNEAAKSLAKRHDLQTAERGAEHYRNSLIGGLAILGKSLAQAVVLVTPTVLCSIASALLFPELGNLGFLPGGLVGVVASFALVFAAIRLRVDKEAAVRIARENSGARHYTMDEIAREGVF